MTDTKNLFSNFLIPCIIITYCDLPRSLFFINLYASLTLSVGALLKNIIKIKAPELKALGGLLRVQFNVSGFPDG